MLSRFSRVQLCTTLWTVAHRTPLSRQGYWSGLPCPPPVNLPHPGIEPHLLWPLHCRQILYHWATREASFYHTWLQMNCVAQDQKSTIIFPEFHIYKMKSFVFLWKKYHWNFYEDCIESIDFFGWCEHFNNPLSMSTKCLSFSVFSFFHHCLIVFSVQVFHILVKFISMYFILFDAIVSGILFLISLSDILLLVYKNNRFCVLILYPEALLNSFIISNNFLSKSLGFLHIICHLQIVIVLFFPFPFGCPIFLSLV